MSCVAENKVGIAGEGKDGEKRESRQGPNVEVKMMMMMMMMIMILFI